MTFIVASLSPYICKAEEDIPVFSTVLIILGLNFAMGFPMRTFGGILGATRRFDIISYARLIGLLVRTILIVAVLSYGYGVVSMAWVSVATSLFTNGIQFYYAKKNAPFFKIGRRYFQSSRVKVLFAYSAFAFVGKLGDLMRFQLDAMVISAYLGLAPVTHYKISTLIVKQFRKFMLAVMGVLQPHFSHLHGAEEFDLIKKVFVFSTRLSVYTSSFIAFCSIVLGHAFIERWVGAEYLDAYPCLVFLVLGTCVALWQAPTAPLLLGTSKHHFIAYLHSGEGVVNIILSLILVQKYGIVGVAIGTFIPLLVTKICIQPIFVCKVSGVPYREYMAGLGVSIFRSLCALIVPTVVSLRFAAPNFMILFVLGVSSVVMYSLTIWVFGGFTPVEKSRLKAAILPKKLNRGVSSTKVEEASVT